MSLYYCERAASVAGGSVPFRPGFANTRECVEEYYFTVLRRMFPDCETLTALGRANPIS